MIQSIEISKFGRPDVMRLVEAPSAPLRLDGVRINVTASGVNFADLMMRMGLYPEAPPPPFIPGYEVSGKVLEVGPAVKTIRPGDRVLAGSKFGGYTTEITLPEYQVRKIPDRLSEVEAAAIPVNFLTAWMALHEMGRIRKGDRVLIQSAAGGVGVAAVQIAAQAGAKIVGLVGSASKIETVRSLGASEVVLQNEWDELSDEEAGGFQIILDSSGGESLKRSLRRLSASGRVISFGASSSVAGQKRSIPHLISLLMNTSILTPFKLMMENKGIFGLNLLQLLKNPSAGDFNPVYSAFDQIMERFEDGSFKVIIGKTFPLAQAGTAHTYLQSRANIGKVLLLSPHHSD
jgi:NADPH:quinone reductase-like Zn-dependent oxidoreductase